MFVFINNHVVFFLFSWCMLTNQDVTCKHVAKNTKLLSVPWFHQSYFNVLNFILYILSSFFLQDIYWVLVRCTLTHSYKLISFHILWFVNSFTFEARLSFGWLGRRDWNIKLYMTNMCLFEFCVFPLFFRPQKIMDKFAVTHLQFGIRFVFPQLFNDVVNVMASLDHGA